MFIELEHLNWILDQKKLCGILVVNKSNEFTIFYPVLPNVSFVVSVCVVLAIEPSLLGNCFYRQYNVQDHAADLYIYAPYMGVQDWSFRSTISASYSRIEPIGNLCHVTCDNARQMVLVTGRIGCPYQQQIHTSLTSTCPNRHPILFLSIYSVLFCTLWDIIIVFLVEIGADPFKSTFPLRIITKRFSKRTPLLNFQPIRPSQVGECFQSKNLANLI
jgi:hypothetical protein